MGWGRGKTSATPHFHSITSCTEFEPGTIKKRSFYMSLMIFRWTSLLLESVEKPSLILQRTKRSCNTTLRRDAATRRCDTFLRHDAASRRCDMLLRHQAATRPCETTLPHGVALQHEAGAILCAPRRPPGPSDLPVDLRKRKRSESGDVMAEKMTCVLMLLWNAFAARIP